MPDRLGQGKETKRSKTLLTVALVLVALNVLLFLLVPTQRTIACDEDTVIYSVADEGFEKPCHVTLTGVLTQSVLLQDTFEGSIDVTDVPGLEKAMPISLKRENGRWSGYVHDEAGQAVQTGVWDVEATKEFEHITIAFATTYEREGDQVRAAFDPANATFVSLGAPNRSYALRQFQELIWKEG